MIVPAYLSENEQSLSAKDLICKINALLDQMEQFTAEFETETCAHAELVVETGAAGNPFLRRAGQRLLSATLSAKIVQIKIASKVA